MKRIGAVLYEGPSELDGDPIVVILTGFQASVNAKTGKMLQVWVLRSDMNPVEALARAKDAAICGDCPQRVSTGGACYVRVEKAPLSIYRAWKRGRYEDWTTRFPDRALAGRSVRFGAYGDPAAVPYRIWKRVRRRNRLASWTGYTHQWRKAPHLRSFLMASVDSAEEADEAAALGWRTFRVRLEDEPILTSEITCPSEKTTCLECALCQGASKLARSVTILAHGGLVSRLRRKALPVAV